MGSFSLPKGDGKKRTEILVYVTLKWKPILQAEGGRCFGGDRFNTGRYGHRGGKFMKFASAGCEEIHAERGDGSGTGKREGLNRTMLRTLKGSSSSQPCPRKRKGGKTKSGSTEFTPPKREMLKEGSIQKTPPTLKILSKRSGAREAERLL